MIPQIFRNIKNTTWIELDEGFTNAKRINKTICGFGLLEKFYRSQKISPYTFTYLDECEYQKGVNFDKENKNEGEKLVRFTSSTLSAGEINALCILNADKGYMRYMENIENQPQS